MPGMTTRKTYVPERLEMVIARSFEDSPALVLAVDRRRERALLHVEQPGGVIRRWDWFSMIAPRSAAPPNPAAGFLRSCRADPGAWTPTSGLYRAYRAWCAGNGTAPVNMKRFTNGLTAAGFRPGMRWTGPAGKKVKVRVRIGIILLP